MADLSRDEYAGRYGPTTDDRLRLGDTDLWVRVEDDHVGFGDEPIWLLKEGESPQPNNLDTLFLWSLLLGIMNQTEPGAAADPE